MNFEINSSNMNLKYLVTFNARCRAVFLFFLFSIMFFLYIDTYSRAFKRIGLELCTVNSYRGITAGATAVAPKFSDTLTLYQPGGQILHTIAEVEPKFSPWLCPCRAN